MYVAVIVAMMLNGELVTLKPSDRFDTHAECMLVTATFAAEYNWMMMQQGHPAAGFVIDCEKGADA
jgi:hypothetical protein